MKMRFSVIMLAVLLSAALTAADVGGAIGETMPPFKGAMISGEAVSWRKKSSETDGWVLSVFFTAPSAGIADQSRILARAVGDRGRVVLISAAPAAMLEDFAAEPVGIDVSICRDADNDMAARVLPGNVVLPFAVLADASGRIRWMGEPVEAAEAFDGILAGTYPVSRRETLLPLYSKLAVAVRSGSFRDIRMVCRLMMEIEPANCTAIQAMMFCFENSGDPEGAWEMLSDKIGSYPDNRFLMMTAFNFGAMHAEYAGRVTALAGSAGLPEFSDYEKRAACFMLLHGYWFDLGALRLAGTLLDTMDGNDPDVLELKALASYRSGDLAGAAACQQRAAETASAASGAAERLEFYLALKAELNGGEE